MSILPKGPTEREIEEITIFKNVEPDQESPDFPLKLGVTTMDALKIDILNFLENNDEIAGIVTIHNDSFRIISQKSDLPNEATVQIITKKGKKYI